jgi:hypothetical protein
MNENQNLSPEERVKLLLRERVELEIKKQKLHDRLLKIEDELIDKYLDDHLSCPNKSAFLQDNNLVRYEETLYLFVFDLNEGMGSLTVTLANSAAYIQV